MNISDVAGGAKEATLELQKFDVNGNPTGVRRSVYWNVNPFTRWRVNLALWLGKGKVKLI